MRDTSLLEDLTHLICKLSQVELLEADGLNDVTKIKLLRHHLIDFLNDKLSQLKGV